MAIRDQEALDYHSVGRPGKTEVVPTKPCLTARDLSLAYTPGVAVPCLAIEKNPEDAYKYTNKGNLVAVLSNGTAVLGLGDIGAVSGKPVMEGKGVLFKRFAHVDVFDIEVNTHDPDEIIKVAQLLEPTFGGINLEDIKAPECFYIEETLKKTMKIPVFHDDQHGTAIIVAAAIINGLKVVGKRIEEVKLVCSGAGAAALACLDLLVKLGLQMDHVTVSDIKGVVYKGRKELMDPLKERYARETSARTLGEIIEGADVFLGLSAGGVLKKEMVARMAARPLILALANPTPEIMPEEAKAVRQDAVIATGRSDYPNQVNNVLCFPFIFRGALDVGASAINEEMKLAAVRAIAELAQQEESDVVAAIYGGEPTSFGPEHLIPKPFDPRLIVRIAPAVARAAVESGVATRRIEDWEAYRSQLTRFVYHSGHIMRPVFETARASPQRIIYCEGEEERVLRAVQTVVDESLARPIVIGRPYVVNMRIERAGLRIRPGVHFELVNQDSDARYRELWTYYHDLMERRGVSVEYAKLEVRRRATLIGALLIQLGHADGMICGTHGAFATHLATVRNVIGTRPGVKTLATMNALLLPGRTVFICDTHVNYDPTPEEVAEMTVLAAEEVRRFGLEPKVALLSHSSFGTHDTPSAVKMREALRILGEIAPQLEVEGEMQGDAALSEDIRRQVFPRSRLKGPANLLIAPTLDAASISLNLLKSAAGDGVTIGPLLLGAARPAHILSPTATPRGIVNVSALTAVAAAARAKG